MGLRRAAVVAVQHTIRPRRRASRSPDMPLRGAGTPVQAGKRFWLVHRTGARGALAASWRRLAAHLAPRAALGRESVIARRRSGWSPATSPTARASRPSDAPAIRVGGEVLVGRGGELVRRQARAIRQPDAPAPGLVWGFACTGRYACTRASVHVYNLARPSHWWWRVLCAVPSGTAAHNSARPEQQPVASVLYVLSLQAADFTSFFGA